MRDLVYYVAATLDGFIAHEDGSFDGFAWDDDFIAALRAEFPETFPVHLGGPATPAENRHFGAVLMGRKTYAHALREGITSPYPTLDSYVFSRSMTESPDPAVTLVRDDAGAVVRGLKQESGKAIWLCGGAVLAATLHAAGLIDRLVLKLNPVLFGAGIPLFAGNPALTNLELMESSAYPSGHVLLDYRIRAGS